MSNHKTIGMIGKSWGVKQKSLFLSTPKMKFLLSLDHVEDADSASLHHDNSPEPDHGDVWIDWNKLIDEELRNSISDTMSICQ